MVYILGDILRIVKPHSVLGEVDVSEVGVAYEVPTFGIGRSRRGNIRVAPW